MKHWSRACFVLSLALPLARASAQKLDLDEFLKPSAPKAAAAEPSAPAPPASAPSHPVAPAQPAAHPAAPPAAKARAHPAAGAAAHPAAGAAAPPAAGAAAPPAAGAPAHPAAPAHGTKSASDEAAPTPAAEPTSEPEPAATSGRRRHTASAAQRERTEKLPRAEKPKREKKKTVYDLMCEGWHAPPEPELVRQWDAAAVPDLVFHVHKTGEVYTLRPKSRQGEFDETQLQIAKEAFQSWGPTPHPRTLDLVYAAVLHFRAPYVTLISGVRKDRGGSRHSHGLAADIVLPGVDDETLAAFFRAQGFCGVGTYPRSGFVHIDTRDASYFWIDNSKPNQHGRVMQVRKEESAAADAAALARGASFVNPPKLQKALNVRLVRKRKQHQAKLDRAAAAQGPSAAAQSKAPNE